MASRRAHKYGKTLMAIGSAQNLCFCTFLLGTALQKAERNGHVQSGGPGGTTTANLALPAGDSPSNRVGGWYMAGAEVFPLPATVSALAVMWRSAPTSSAPASGAASPGRRRAVTVASPRHLHHRRRRHPPVAWTQTRCVCVA